MTRTDVIKKFLNKEKATSGARDIWTGGHVASISSNGMTLYSYWTPIATWADDGAGGHEKVIMDAQKYSSTTSRQQSELRFQAKQAGVILEEKAGALYA